MTEKQIIFNLIHSDDRREIYSNTDLLNGKEVSIIKLKGGKAIGGCVHSKNEGFAILNGYGCMNIGGEIKDYGSYKFIAGDIEKWKPHAFFAEDDSIIIEWGLTFEDKLNNPKDQELKEEVDEFNEDTHSV